MSGHNKWSQIKHKKGAADAARSDAFGKVARRIVVESKAAGGDVTLPNLRSIIEKARKLNMPKDKIDKAVAKGTSNDAGAMESITYEGYGPGGAAIIIETVTDNKNRTVQELKHLFSKNGYALATPGAAAWAFEKTTEGYEPKSTIPLSDADNESLIKFLVTLDAHEDVEDIYTNAA